MKLKKEDANSNSLGVVGAKEFTVDTSNQMIVSILRDKLYSNKIAAVCREVASNSRDANRESGKEDSPITISIYQEDSITDEVQSFISFQDEGIGISPDRIENVFLKYGSSTKRDTNNQTGGFGIGAKTPFAYSHEFLIETVSDHKGKRIKNIYQSIIMNETGIESTNLIPISEEETDEPTGTKIIVPIKQKDIYDFEKESIKATTFWKTKPNYVGFSNLKNVNAKHAVEKNNWSILEGQYSDVLDVDSYELFILVDGIPYQFDNRKVSPEFKGIKESFLLSVDTYSYDTVYINPVLTFETGEITLSASREEIEYTESNLELIQKRIKEVEKDLIKEVKSIINKKESKIEKILFINSFKVSHTTDALGKFLKKVNLFDKIKDDYDLSLDLRSLFMDTLNLNTLQGRQLNNNYEIYKFNSDALSLRMSKKTKTGVNVDFDANNVRNSIFIFKSVNDRMNTAINRTLLNSGKNVYIISYGNSILQEVSFNEKVLKDELKKLLKPINSEVSFYDEVEKTKAPRNYNRDYVKQDKNIKTIYVREFVKAGAFIKNSYKYKEEEKEIQALENNKNIFLSLNGHYELKDLDRVNIDLSEMIDLEVDFIHKNHDTVYQMLRFVAEFGYKIIFVKNENQLKSISNTPQNTLQKVMNKILKNKTLKKAFKEYIEKDFVSGVGMVKKDSSLYQKLNAGLLGKCLKLVDFNLKDYKLSNNNSSEEDSNKNERELEGVEKIVYRLLNNYCFRSLKLNIQKHLSGEINMENFEGFLTEEIVDKFKGKLKLQYPIIENSLKELDGYSYAVDGCTIYGDDDDSSILKTGKENWIGHLNRIIDFEMERKNSNTNNIIIDNTKKRGRGRPKGSKNKVKQI